tara:strand:- start:104 stop:244 length:141 start_codon:yes stop_codon:yes gene_type:complete
MKKIIKEIVELICLVIIVVAVVSIANDTKIMANVFTDPTTYTVNYE